MSTLVRCDVRAFKLAKQSVNPQDCAVIILISQCAARNALRDGKEVRKKDSARK